MKRLVVCALFVAVAVAPSANASTTTQFGLPVVPLECEVELVVDGTTTTVILTPEECDLYYNPPPPPPDPEPEPTPNQPNLTPIREREPAEEPLFGSRPLFPGEQPSERPIGQPAPTGRETGTVITYYEREPEIEPQAVARQVTNSISTVVGIAVTGAAIAVAVDALIVSSSSSLGDFLVAVARRLRHLFGKR